MNAGLLTACLLALAGYGTRAAATPPVIYSNPEYESPVRAEPDDLLLIPGYGFKADDTVIYEALDDTTQPLRTPQAVPDTSDERRGIAAIVSTANVPLSLTVKLPKEMRAGQAYALWVRTRTNEWSNGVKLNDARPLWISPGYVQETKSVAGLARYLKVIGRNLQPAPGAATRVRLAGPETLELTAAAAKDPASALPRYAAQVSLPARLRAGEYAVSLSRGGKSWVAVPNQKLIVRRDPAPATVFDISDPRFGGCRADDNRDDTLCIRRALDAAGATGGGTVQLDKGIWTISAEAIAEAGTEGLIIPRGVNLQGQGTQATSLVRTAAPDSKPITPAFSLLGRTTVSGIHFKDAAAWNPQDRPAPMLKLGRAYDRTEAGARIVEDIVVTANRFDRTHPALGSGGLPVRRLFVTHNEFGAYDFGVIVRGDRFNMTDRFLIEDAVFTHNVFKPGSYLDVKIRQGAIASQLGGALRMDFSNNTADGTATEYLDGPNAAAGWRAAFFWNLSGAQEHLLISENTATCTGDKAGDGEAIAFDNDGNAFGFGGARAVLASTANELTLDSALRDRQQKRTPGPQFYIGHYVQIVAGRGLGQTRRIDGYRNDTAAGRVVLTVSPAWDIPPDTGSRAIVGRQFRQAYIVANTVDHRQPLCRKSNRTAPKGGVIGLWSQTADSVVEGNTQYDTDGILTNQNYNAENPACPSCYETAAYVQSFVEIRGNTIDGEYDWNSDCSHSGIYIANSAAPTPGSAPPTMNYGVSIVGNTIRRADGLRGGAIVVPLTWHRGPAPYNWPVINNLLIQHNVIEDLTGPPPRTSCDRPQTGRTGINLHQADLVRNTVLYANACSNVSKKLYDSARGTVRVCPSGVRDSCECREAP